MVEWQNCCFLCWQLCGCSKQRRNTIGCKIRVVGRWSLWFCISTKVCWCLVDCWPWVLKLVNSSPPMMTYTRRTYIPFSHWLEFIRKDVECTFVILYVQFQNIYEQNSIGRTRVSGLHSWPAVLFIIDFFHEDGLNRTWEDGVLSEWKWELGIHNVRDVEYHIPVLSRIGFGKDVRDGEQPPLPLPTSH